jgi:hypothetical protein
MHDADGGCHDPAWPLQSNLASFLVACNSEKRVMFIYMNIEPCPGGMAGCVRTSLSDENFDVGGRAGAYEPGVVQW